MSSSVSRRGSTITTRSGGAARSQRSTAARISPPEWPLRKAALSASRIISSSPRASSSAAGDARPHVDAGPAPQLDVARRLEVAVGGRDRVRVQAEPARERAHRGQPLAGSEHTAQDPQLELRQQLVVERHAPLALEHEVHWFVLAKLGDYGPVRSLFATGRARLLARVGLYGSAVLRRPARVALSQVLDRDASASRPRAARPPWQETTPRTPRACGCGRGSPRATTAGAAVVLVHGLGDSLESQADSGERLHRRGHTVLLLDLRAHGGSEGRYTTLGGREREDVRAALARAARQDGHGRAGLRAVRGVDGGRRRAARRRGGRATCAPWWPRRPYDDYRATIGAPRAPLLRAARAGSRSFPPRSRWRSGGRASTPPR